LRQNVDRNRVFTYHDADESGNYNPALEARERALELNKCKATKKAKKSEKAKVSEKAKKPEKARDSEKTKKKKTTEKTEEGGKKKEKKKKTAKGCLKISKPVSRPPGNSRARTKYLTAEDLKDIEDGEEDECTTSREATPEMILEDQAGNTGPVTEIQTSFAHPMQFNFSPVGNCSFCEISLFGVTGHFEKSVHVIQWDTGLGFTEIGGGHCDKNSPTKMCDTCTRIRVSISTCEAHKLQQIYAVDEMTFEDTLEDLLAAPGGSPEMHNQLQRWCSMCFLPASFGCCAYLGGEVIGCGLRLCDRCEIDLREKFGGCSLTMAEALCEQPMIKKTDQEWKGRVRADVGLLSGTGLLMKLFLGQCDSVEE
jgi:hypothetical protein